MVRFMMPETEPEPEQLWKEDRPLKNPGARFFDYLFMEGMENFIEEMENRIQRRTENKMYADGMEEFKKQDEALFREATEDIQREPLGYEEQLRIWQDNDEINGAIKEVQNEHRPEEPTQDSMEDISGIMKSRIDGIF